MNLRSEISDWNFDALRTKSSQEWGEALGSIKIQGGDHRDRVVFYTALYHAMLSPDRFSDVDGRFRGMDGLIHHAVDREYPVTQILDYPISPVPFVERGNQTFVGSCEVALGVAFMPLEVTFWISEDAADWREIGTVRNEVPENASGSIIRDFTVTFPKVATRYVRVFAKNRGVCPSWHVGSGSPCWIFADEIVIQP